MSASPVIRAASGAIKRYRTQAVVIFAALLVSAMASTLGLGLLVASSGPFQRAFDAQHGAHLTVMANSAQVTNAQLTASGRLPQVTEAAGPFPVANVTLAEQDNGLIFRALGVAGRSSPGGALDDISLQAGHWPDGPGQIVLSTDLGYSNLLNRGFAVTTAPGKPVLMVVGMATSVTSTAEAWVSPAELTALRVPSSQQMLYRFAKAGTAAQIGADLAAVTRALPAGSVISSASWLTAEQQANGRNSIIAPFVTAFAILGLALSALMVANVIGGAVAASYRRIGVLKSIGFTPAQVVLAYIARVGIPVVAGCVIGVAAGNVVAIPVLHRSATAFNVGAQTVPAWVDVATLVALCLLSGIAALVPALRAGRLSAVDAISMGQAPRRGHGYAAQRLAGRIRLARPVTVGLAAPFARPARTLVTLAAIVFGATAVIFAVGLHSSLARVASAEGRTTLGQANLIMPLGSAVRPGSSEDRKYTAAIGSQRGTQDYVAQASPVVSAIGLTQPIQATAFIGDPSWTALDMVSGHWYSGPGGVVVNGAFLTQTGLSVGNTVSLTSNGQRYTPQIVGEVFDPKGSDQAALFTDWRTLGGSAVGLTISQYDIELRPGVLPGVYANSLGYSLASIERGQGLVTTATALIGLLTFMIAVAAGLGVMNTVLLSIRERVRDLGVFKAIGMTPRQTIVMVMCWMVGPATVAAAIAVPLAIVLHSVTVRVTGNAAGTGIPPDVATVYGTVELILLALSALVIAALSAAAPAGWAARAKTVTALRAE